MYPPALIIIALKLLLAFCIHPIISLSEFDKQIPKLVDYFPNDISVLIKVRVKADCIEATLIENPNKNNFNIVFYFCF